VICLFHDNPESGQFEALNTSGLVSRDFYQPAMDSHVHKYVNSCKVCHQIKGPWHTRHGINMPLETPTGPCKGVMMDFVNDLPESTASGYTRILVIADPLTKIAIDLLCWKDIDLPEIAMLILQHVICKCSVPDNIVTNRGTQYTSRFWT